ncbi:MAG: hypothetical protein ACK2T2_11040 [Anaerolineales bacterium]
MRKQLALTLILISAVLLGACGLLPGGNGDAVATSVAATLAAGAPPPAPPTATQQPAPAEGTVSGRVCFPSEPPLPEMTLYFMEPSSGAVISVPHTDGTGTYSAQLPPGSYFAYAWVNGNTTLGGSYSQAVPCGLSVNCTDHSLISFSVDPGGQTTEIDICDWYGAPGDVPLPPGAPTLPSATATNTPPPGGISFNCDGSYQRMQIADYGATGKVVTVDRWDGSKWVNIWNTSGGDPNLQQVSDDSGPYTFGSCQQLLVIAIRHSNPQVTLDLAVYAWNGSGLNQVYAMQGDYGEWNRAENRLIFKKASKLGNVGDGPLQACEWTTTEHTWDGAAFTETNRSVETVPNCNVTVP